MWATSRKYVFYGIFKNTTKHQKIFFETFFEMQSNTWKYFFFRKYFYTNQTQPYFLIGHYFCFNKLGGIMIFLVDCLFIFLIEHSFFYKGILVNLYQFYFSSSHFSFQLNKWVFYPFTFLSFQLETHTRKLKISSILPLFYSFLIFYHPTFAPLQLN